MLLSGIIAANMQYKEAAEGTLQHGAALVFWYAKSLIAVAPAKMLSSETSDVMGDSIEIFSDLLLLQEAYFSVVPISHEACRAPFAE